MRNKKGISLIVLIITIVVVIILASIVISNMEDQDIISGAKEATAKNNFKTFDDEFNVFVQKQIVNSKGKFDVNTLNATLDSISFNTKTNSSTEKNIFDILPSLKGTKYQSNVKIVSGKLVIENLSDQETSYAMNVAQNASSSSYDTAIVNSVVQNNNSTINGLAAKFSNPVIPVGFKAVNTTDASWADANSDGNPDGWNNGLVISDAQGNEFVWVPVDGTDVKYEKNFTYPSNYSATSSNTSDVPTEELVSGVSEGAQISKYGGFYIGRYEAGVPANQSAINSSSAETSNVSGVPQSKKGATPWAWIDYSTANSNAKSLYNTSYVKSGLMTGTMWDTTCKWIKNSGKDITDSRTYGNYNNSQSPANVSGAGARQVTGYSEYWKVKNIYDLAGNVWEWTNEKYSSNRVRRGGSNVNDGSVNPVSYRLHIDVAVTNGYVGFRVSLYIL